MGRKTTSSHRAAPGAKPGRGGLGLAVAAVALVAAVAGVYGQARSFEFLNYDDQAYVYENPHVYQGLNSANARWAFESYEGNWHPVTWLAHELDATLFGAGPTEKTTRLGVTLPASGWHHLVNVALHAANAVLLLVLLVRLTGAPWRSALVAGLFALHPLHVESVAWLAERKDVLSTCFMLLAMLAYVAYVRREGRGRWAWYAATVGLYALGLMAKPMVVTVPFVLLLLDYWPLGRMKGGIRTVAALNMAANNAAMPPGAGAAKQMGYDPICLVEKIPLFVLAGASCVVTFIAQRAGGAVADIDAVSLGARLGNAVLAYGAYLRKTVWPADLAYFYPYSHALAPAAVGLAAVVLAAVTVAAVRWRRTRPYLLVGWLWYLGMLVPVIGLVQVGGQAMADRYTYVPLAGVFIMIVWGVGDLAAGRRSTAVAAGVAGLAALAVLAGLTWRQAATWHDGLTVAQQALAATGENFQTDKNLADALEERGRWAEAIPYYYQALAEHPEDASTRCNFANALANTGDGDGAIREYRAAIKLRETHAPSHFNLAEMLMGKAGRLPPGEQARRAGLVTEALGEYRRAFEINPNFYQAHYGLALALFQGGNAAAALPEFLETIRLQPRHQDALFWAALVMSVSPEAALRNGPRALELAERARRLAGEPTPPRVLNVVASALAENGRYDEAAAVLRGNLKQVAAERAAAVAARAAALAAGDKARAASLEAEIADDDHVTGMVRSALATFESHQPLRLPLAAPPGRP